MEKLISLQHYDSPYGRLVLASFADRLCLCDWSDNPFAERNRRRIEKYLKATSKTETTSVLEETKRQLDEYFAGKRKAFVAYKTMDFMVNKNALPKDIRKKLGI